MFPAAICGVPPSLHKAGGSSCWDPTMDYPETPHDFYFGNTECAASHAGRVAARCDEEQQAYLAKPAKRISISLHSRSQHGEEREPPRE